MKAKPMADEIKAKQDELEEAKKTGKSEEKDAENVAPGKKEKTDDDEDEEDMEEGADPKKKMKKEGEDEDGEDDEVEESVKAIEIDVTEDVSALLNGEDLSEEFQAKTNTIFESAVQRHVTIIQEKLIEASAVKLQEEVQKVQEKQEAQIDQFLDYVVGEWMTENKLAVESGIKSELTEDFIVSLKALFEDHYIEIPDGKEDVLEGMIEENLSIEEKLNEEIAKGIETKQALREAQQFLIFTKLSEDLADTQAEKFKQLVEDIDVSDNTEYQTKLALIKENYFNKSETPKDDQKQQISEDGNDLKHAGTNQQLNNEADNDKKIVDPRIQATVDAISKMRI